MGTFNLTRHVLVVGSNSELSYLASHNDHFKNHYWTWDAKVVRDQNENFHNMTKVIPHIPFSRGRDRHSPAGDATLD